MQDKINEEVLSILRKNTLDNKIEIDFIPIENLLANEINFLKSNCDSKTVTLTKLAQFVGGNKKLNQLSNIYRYCVNLKGIYQNFIADNNATVFEIMSMNQFIITNKNKDPENYNAEESVLKFKQLIKEKYILWQKAYSISELYKLCKTDKNIIAFSHRRDGWSNPIYKLSENLSVEIKTNFGYGNSSYFYTKIKYKNIEITPFSEWVDYEYARFTEIVRYTRTYSLENKNWLQAMEFSKEACNLSLENEDLFVEKYIISECEKMISGLEGIMKKENFSFKNRENDDYKIEKKGHILVEFRGEKVSGALDFIRKIIEFENIITIKDFIARIEICSKIIQPILIKHSEIIDKELEVLLNELKILKPNYDSIIEQKNLYVDKKKQLQIQMLENRILNLKIFDYEKLDNEFLIKYPEYEKFKVEYEKVIIEYNTLKESHLRLTKIFENIVSYNKKIIKYFS